MDSLSKFFNEYKDYLFYSLIIMGLAMIVTSILFVSVEIKEARNYCESVGGKYNLNFSVSEVEHLCNKQLILKYDNGWNFKRNLEIKSFYP